MIVLTLSVPAALATLLLAGVAWMALTSTLAAELQLFLPVWVRARALAVFMLTFTGSMTVGALVWGLVAEAFGLQPTYLVAATCYWPVSSQECSCGCRKPVTSTGRRPYLARSPTGLRSRARQRARRGDG